MCLYLIFSDLLKCFVTVHARNYKQAKAMVR